MARLKGKKALITGAGGGLGKALVDRFSAEGAELILADINLESIQAMAEQLPNAQACELDVGNESSWQKAIALAREQFDGLDILVNGAGIIRIEPLSTMTLEGYEHIINVNQTSVFLGMKYASELMAEKNQTELAGSIINISSTAGIQGGWGTSAYCASKFAVRGMSKVAAMELGSKGIRVNSVHPGAILTPMLDGFGDHATEGMKGRPITRVAQPVEVANMVVFLASDESSYCTGSEYVVDGGLLAGNPA